ncbi:MAG: gas vesicle protein K [Gemmatimonadaceae bacterium]
MTDSPRPDGRDGAGDPASATDALLAELSAVARALPERINADPERVEQGLAQLVLTLVEVLRKVLEHQAVRRMEGGTLTDDEVERLGLALLRLNDRMRELKNAFGLSDEDLVIDLGPLGRLG